MNYEKIIKNMTSQKQQKLLNGFRVLPEYQKHTLETLVEVLDLQHPDVYEENLKDWDYYPRQSGRTTMMLLNACLAVQNQLVLVLGHTPHYTDTLQQQLYEMCTKTGISHTENVVRRYIPINFNFSEALKGYHDIKVFEDHVRLEMISKWSKPKTFEEIIVETSDGNPGAMMAIRALQYLSTWEESVRQLHKHGIIGEKLYSLWGVYGLSRIQWCEAVKATMMIPELTSSEAYQSLLDKAPLKNQKYN